MLVDDLGAVVDGDQILYILAKAAKLQGNMTVSYTHLTLPTNREV